jgi:hypothetical protein
MAVVETPKRWAITRFVSPIRNLRLISKTISAVNLANGDMKFLCRLSHVPILPLRAASAAFVFGVPS